MDRNSFYSGDMFDAYLHLGCHPTRRGAFFRVYAPSALAVAVVGDFNCWCETPLERVYDDKFYQVYIEGAREGMLYKLRITQRDGSKVDHCDPYGFAMEKLPGFASVIVDRESYIFSDERWMRQRTDCKNAPLNIYEIHAGSWKRKDGEFYTYRELADLLIPYVRENGYNYIEFMPLGEHPCDSSWGYQTTGFFAPTSRYGTPNDLKYLIDRCHAENIGVLLDFVPVHFAVDYYGLAYFDGTHLYEYSHDDIGYNEWGSKNFNHSKGEVQSFLKSCANYWLTEFHFDGIRIDALSNLIYWQGKRERGVNERAADFIRSFCRGLKERHPAAILAAEDSTAFPGVTRATAEGGLGFDYKWDMGWMHDTLNYFKMGTEDRRSAYHKLTFSMLYFYNENYLLPLSHDEVVHGKATIVQKMNGIYVDKFPQARAMYMYMFAHPGKKLNFMGSEFAQLREWDESREQDWDMLKYPAHNSFHRFMRDLSRIYLASPAMWASDHEGGGFRWLDCEQDGSCAYAIERCGGGERLIALFNFANKYYSYKLNIGCADSAELVLDSDRDIYSGSTTGEAKYSLKKGLLASDLPPFSAKYFAIK